MKADQERVKNLLIDTVTLLCKNSLTYEDELCVEGLLGVKVDQKDVFFVHISETFPSALSVQKAQERQRQQELAAAEAAERSPGTPGSSSGQKRSHSLTDSPAHRNSPQSRLGGSSSKVNIKTESVDSEDDCCITEDPSQPPPVLRTPSSVGAHPAQRIAGQRRAVHSPRSPSHSDSPYSAEQHHQQTFQSNSSFSQEEYPEFSHVGKSEGDGGDGEPPRKRAAMSEDGDDSYSGSQWPNLAGVQGIGDFAGQVAQQAFQDSGDSQMSGGGDMSQPGCSSWPTGLQQQATDTMTKLYPSDMKNLPPGKYNCDVCGKVLQRQLHLDMHKRTHTGEKPYQCYMCNFACAVKGNLKNHLRRMHKSEVTIEDMEKYLSQIK